MTFPTYPVLKAVFAVSIAAALTATEWFWTPVPTPVGIIVVLAIFPPTVLISLGVALGEKYLNVDVPNR